jgi:hypothetical protein
MVQHSFIYWFLSISSHLANAAKEMPACGVSLLLCDELSRLFGLPPNRLSRNEIDGGIPQYWRVPHRDVMPVVKGGGSAGAFHGGSGGGPHR